MFAPPPFFDMGKISATSTLALYQLDNHLYKYCVQTYLAVTMTYISTPGERKFIYSFFIKCNLPAEFCNSLTFQLQVWNNSKDLAATKMLKASSLESSYQQCTKSKLQCLTLFDDQIVDPARFFVKITAPDIQETISKFIF